MSYDQLHQREMREQLAADKTAPSVQIDKGNLPTPEQLAGALWDAVFGKGAWDNAERCNANREIRNRWIVAVAPFCGVPANITARFKARARREAEENAFPSNAESTLNEIDAMAAKHGLVLIKMPPPPDKRYWEERTPASLTAQLTMPDARLGSGK